PTRRLDAFARCRFGPLGAASANAVGASGYGLPFAKVGKAPGDDCTRRFFRKLDRYSATHAVMADTAMLTLGGKLKLKESLSGRLGDVPSQLYIGSALLKRFHDEGCQEGERPLLAWALHDSLNKLETALSGALRNFPIRPIGWLLWLLVFPLGRRAQPPGDRLSRRAAAILMTPCEARARLARGVFLTPGPNNPAGRIDSYLPKVVLAE